MVGLSLAMNDSNVEAPIDVTGGGEHRVGVLGTQLLDRTGQRRGTGRGARRVVEQPAVEVVGGQHLHRVDVGVG